MDLYIITGASRGLGLALAQALLQPGGRMLTLARHPAAELEPLAVDRGASLEQWSVDLADALPVAERLRAWLTTVHGAKAPAAFRSVTLVNNAALLAEPAALTVSAAAELSAAIRVSLEAPVLLTSAFLAATEDWAIPRKVLNISSGLGRFAMAGAASYCASKAGLDHFTRAVALEEEKKPHGARLVSLAPGVIATDMQVQLRSADAARFTNRQRFVDMHAGGMLDSPTQAAAKVLAYLARPDFGANPVADVREG